MSVLFGRRAIFLLHVGRRVIFLYQEGGSTDKFGYNVKFKRVFLKCLIGFLALKF